MFLTDTTPTEINDIIKNQKTSDTAIVVLKAANNV